MNTMPIVTASADRMMRIRSSPRCSVSVIVSSAGGGASCFVGGHVAEPSTGFGRDRRRSSRRCGHRSPRWRWRWRRRRRWRRRWRRRRSPVAAPVAEAVAAAAAAVARGGGRAGGRGVGGTASRASAHRRRDRRRLLHRPGVFEALFGLGLLEDLRRIGGVADQLGGLAHLAHRLVEGRFQLGLEPVAHLLQLGVGLGELADRVRQLLRAEHHERQDQDHDDLAALEIEHVGSLRACHHLSECSNDSHHCSIRRSRSPIAVRGPTPRRTRSSRSNWPCGSERPGLESDVWLTADGVAGARSRRCGQAGVCAGDRSPTVRAITTPRAHPVTRRDARCLRVAASSCRST